MTPETKITKVRAIRKYFGHRPEEHREGRSASGDFMRELKDLTSDDRLELAQGAAAQLGLTQDQVEFPL